MIHKRTKRSVQQVALAGFILFSLYTILETQLLAPTREWIGFEMQPKTTVIHAKEEVVSPSPTPDKEYEKLIEVVEEAETKSEPLGAIEEYIYKVFGEDAERGLKMLKKCENSTLGATKINWNSNGTKDVGVWQINLESWNVTEEDMLDPYKNTDQAYKIFKAGGSSFYYWTCGYIAGDKTYLSN